MTTPPTIIDTAYLPDGIAGLTDGHTIWLNPNLTTAGRRCTLAHELIHIERGLPPEWAAAREEHIIDRIASIRLTSFEELLDALIWHAGDHNRPALAETLELDLSMTHARLQAVTPQERDTINRHLDNLELGA